MLNGMCERAVTTYVLGSVWWSNKHVKSYSYPRTRVHTDQGDLSRVKPTVRERRQYSTVQYNALPTAARPRLDRLSSASRASKTCSRAKGADDCRILLSREMGDRDAWGDGPPPHAAYKLYIAHAAARVAPRTVYATNARA